MTDKPQLKLVVAYDRNRNEYSIAAHNRTPEEAEGMSPRGLPIFVRTARSSCSTRRGDTGPKRQRIAVPAAKP